MLTSSITSAAFSPLLTHTLSLASYYICQIMDFSLPLTLLKYPIAEQFPYHFDSFFPSFIHISHNRFVFALLDFFFNARNIIYVNLTWSNIDTIWSAEYSNSFPILSGLTITMQDTTWRKNRLFWSNLRRAIAESTVIACLAAHMCFCYGKSKQGPTHTHTERENKERKWIWRIHKQPILLMTHVR